MARILFASVLSVLCLAFVPTRADETVVTALFTERAGPNQYEVTFPPEMGGLQLVLPIEKGECRLAYDIQTGAARFLEWNQEVAAIDLFGASTGPITVRLDPTQPSTGTIQPGSLAFDVSATFILEFDDSQLRLMGITSPFVMSATEHGSIYGVGSLATLAMFVSGTGAFGPGEFTYTCRTSAEVKWELPLGMGQPGDVNGDHRFNLADPVAALAHLFLGSESKCAGAIEVNGDGKKDLSDPLFMLAFLFQGGSAPPATPVPCEE